MTKRPDMVGEWIAFAGEDLQAAAVLLREEIYNQSCFHSQQCVEKILKGYLISRGVHCPKIHDLNELFEKCVQNGLLTLLQFKKPIAMLSLYYVPTRYPDAIIGSLPDRLPNKSDAKESLETAQTIYQHLLNEM